MRSWCDEVWDAQQSQFPRNCKEQDPAHQALIEA
jgi:hypothetical protein